jgi:hypothetical protein
MDPYAAIALEEAVKLNRALEILEIYCRVGTYAAAVAHGLIKNNSLKE